MKKAIAVIGANWGDEGKGRMVDFYATLLKDQNPIVVRYNGGAQAGHTVELPDGRRHIFSHFGAGSFAGVPTFYSEFCIVNPRLFYQEREELLRLDCQPKIAIHTAAPLTTPYDMLINQWVEERRGRSRHGSCGIGINETMQRMQTRHQTCANDLYDLTDLRRRLLNIRVHYVPFRLNALGIKLSAAEFDTLISETVIDKYIEACTYVMDNASLTSKRVLDSRQLIFEGAQGLLLDQDHRFFPHVTHSRTGLPNILSICRDLDIGDIDVTYMTRAYMTRHGAGPFPTDIPNMMFVDCTNIPNQFQGALRFGALDADLLLESIRNDVKAIGNMTADIGLGITCVDQVMDSRMPFVIAGKMLELDGAAGLSKVVSHLDIRLKAESTSPAGALNYYGDLA